jgi:hypothetical protein
LDEALTDPLCDAGYCVPDLLTDYILSGGEELPSRSDLEECIGEYMVPCIDTSDSLDEYVDCVNERYDCFLLLNRFFDALPYLLEVKVVEGEITPDLCSDKVSSEEIVENTAWYVGLRTQGYDGVRVEEDYYGVRDSRVVRFGLGLRGYWCEEGFEKEMLPKLTDRLKELARRPDLIVHVYGNPPVDPKSISISLYVSKLDSPPKP